MPRGVNTEELRNILDSPAAMTMLLYWSWLFMTLCVTPAADMAVPWQVLHYIKLVHKHAIPAS